MEKCINTCLAWFIFMALIVDLTMCQRVHRLLDCSKSKYGCCPDGVTDSLGWNQKGCATLLCYDKEKSCKLMKENGDCSALDRWGEMNELCAKTCGRCLHNGKLASAPACYKSKYGCCHDGVTAAVSEDKRPGVGCPFCQDTYPHTCKQFGDHHWCKGRHPRPRYFLKNNCFKQCGFCRNFKEMVLPRERKDWRKKFY